MGRAEVLLGRMAHSVVRNCREATGSALLSGRWEREFQGPCHPIFAGPYLSIREEGDGVRSEAAFSSTTTCVSDLFSLVLEDGRRGQEGALVDPKSVRSILR